MAGSPSTSKRIHSGVRRRRAILSCHACRTRRLKCDRVRPICGRCARNEDECVWAVDGLSRFPSDVQQHPPSQSDIEADPIHPPDDTTMDTESEVSVPEDFSASAVGQGNHPKNPWTGYLTSQHGGRSRYIPSSFWANIDHDSFELDDVLSSVPLFPFPVCCCNQTSVSRFPTSTEEPPTHVERAPLTSDTKSFLTRHNCCNRMNSLSYLLDGLPPKETCDILYQNFLRCIHPIIILLHIPTFHSQYIRFWDWYGSWNREEIPEGILAEIPSFLPLLFAVLFAGYFGPHDVSRDLDLAVNATTLYSAHSHALLLVSFPQSPTIYSLIAFLIVQNLLVREEESLSACSFIGIALRAAQAMGLHRDGAHFRLDPVQAEIRRRVWWHIIHTDVMTCISSGLPPVMVVDNLYDTNMISEVKDEYLNNHEELVVHQSLGQALGAPENWPQLESESGEISDSQIVDIHHVVAIGRYKITTLMRQILRRQFDVEPMSAKDITALKKAVDQQSTETTARIHRIAKMRLPSTTHLLQGLESSGSANINYDSAFQSWSQILLRLMNHKSYCMLYQPLLRGKYGSVSSRARKDAMRHCHAYIECFLEISTSQLFRPFYWMYPGMYQPLQATAIILADLIKNPDTDEALHSRTLVDRLFSLIGSDGFGSSSEKISKRNLTSAGKDVWEMLRKLRRQAWIKAGLDPEFVWMNPQVEDRKSHSDHPDQGNASEEQEQSQEIVPAITIPNLEPLDTFLQPDTELFSDATWMSNMDISTGPTDQTGQFSLGDVEGFDWQHWDFLLQQSFNMPDPGQSNF